MAVIDASVLVAYLTGGEHAQPARECLLTRVMASGVDLVDERPLHRTAESANGDERKRRSTVRPGNMGFTKFLVLTAAGKV